MPTYAYWDDEDEDRLELTREDIDGGDLEQLKVWWDGLEITGDRIRSQLDAHHAARIGDTLWIWRASQALGFLEIGKAKIRRRMRGMDYDPNPNGTTIAKITAKMSTMKAHAAIGKAFIAAAQARLCAPDFDKLLKAAEREVAEGRANEPASPAVASPREPLRAKG